MVDYLAGLLQQLPRGKFVIPDIQSMLAAAAAAAAIESIGGFIGQLSRSVFIGSGGGEGFWKGAAADGRVTLAITAFAGLALAVAVFYTSRGRLKSPWSRRKRKHILSPQQWRDLFTPNGKLRDNGVKFLKKVCSGGVDPSIRAEVWPFLLGVYDPTSSKEERDITRTKHRKEYVKLRRQCRQLLKHNNQLSKSNQSGGVPTPSEGTISPNSEEVVSARQSLSSEDSSFHNNYDQDQHLPTTSIIDPIVYFDTSDSDSTSDDPDMSQTFDLTETTEDHQPSEMEVQSNPHRNREDLSTWQRIIRLDAVRANEEWMDYNPTLAAVSDEKSRRAAEAVGLKDYDHLGAARMFHAARLVAILEAYAFYDPEIGYCQGMSDLLSPIISVMTVDHEAFWCFVGFMKKARHNFRLDEVGIRRQLSTVSKIIKYKDSHLYRHLEKLQAEDCFFVYRMVVVLFRRELSFEQTLCLWEVMWADQAAIRAGIGKSSWSRIRQRAPPTDDLLLYAIAASVLQRRKQIIERYNSMDEILRECNAMAGHLDVWKLLDDAHGLVVTLHEKIKT